jgi:hypothetical protein
MRTITLELLRHGPPNNQLLSPLTPYLALCENHAAVTVHVPFEHNQFLHRLGALAYKRGQDSRGFYIRDTAQLLAELLGSIPGLTAELSRNSDEPKRLTHLRLIISSSELALLPFELALAPNGFPGAGQPLLLQSQAPICMTRETRRVPEQHVHWPAKPKILLAAASPAGFQRVPLESHLLALRRAIDPWLRQDGSADDFRSRIEQHLVVMPQASDEAIETACATDEFTHVHILAHGVEFQDGYDVRFGLALHDARNPEIAAIADGLRLATILRPSRRPDRDDLARPAVVTLASCNTGTQGSVAGAGASVAHALHEAGVPMVIAGQFPLSFEGSVRLVEVMYEGLLWGDDPRELLTDLRRRLHSQFPKNHDWATVVAYASLPPGLREELTSVKINQAMRSIHVAIGLADRTTRRFFALLRKYKGEELEIPPGSASDLTLLDEAQNRIESSKKKLKSILNDTNIRWSQIYGYLASTEKRQAEILYSASTVQPAQSEEWRHGRAKSTQSLKQARDYYWDAFRYDRANSWGAVQYLSLVIVLRRTASSPENTEPGEQNLDALWTLSHTLSLQDLHSHELEPRIWALSNLIELYLLSQAMQPASGRLDKAAAAEQARGRARELVAFAGRDSFEVYSTRRQMVRYVEWFAELVDLGGIKALAKELADLLPDSWNEQLRRPRQKPT